MFFKGINSKPKQAFGVFIKNSSKVQEEVLNEVWKATFFPPKESRKKKMPFIKIQGGVVLLKAICGAFPSTVTFYEEKTLKATNLSFNLRVTDVFNSK